ncbi:MAG: ParB/RepB/Spo0J family partition protein, partial [Pseudonocardiaceae bacterium]
MPPSSALSHQPAAAVPRKGGLGRGLAALIPTGPVGVPGDPASRLRPDGQVESPTGQVAGAVYQEVPMAAIVPNPRQPRQVFDEDALAELAHSIREFGLLQPIVVRPLPAELAVGHLSTGRYELIMGERR